VPGASPPRRRDKPQVASVGDLRPPAISNGRGNHAAARHFHPRVFVGRSKNMLYGRFTMTSGLNSTVHRGPVSQLDRASRCGCAGSDLGATDNKSPLSLGIGSRIPSQVAARQRLGSDQLTGEPPFSFGKTEVSRLGEIGTGFDSSVPKRFFCWPALSTNETGSLCATQRIGTRST
jgi:hypothetical protein